MCWRGCACGSARKEKPFGALLTTSDRAFRVCTGQGGQPGAAPGGDLPRRLLLVLITALLVARPTLLSEDVGLLGEGPDRAGMVLTLLWLLTGIG